MGGQGKKKAYGDGLSDAMFLNDKGKSRRGDNTFCVQMAILSDTTKFSPKQVMTTTVALMLVETGTMQLDVSLIGHEL